jgi:SNF2 family DNA or RNA helicase
MIYKTKPLKHQEDAVNQFHSQKHGALFCEMGTGKTKIVLDIIRNSAEIFEAVVIAPNGLHHNWAINEIPKHIGSPDLNPVEVYCWKGPIRTKKAKQKFGRFLKPESSRIFLINVEALRTSSGFETTSTFLKTCIGLKHMVIDESTCIKNPKAIQTKRVLDLAGAVDRRWILNGTPITQSPLDLFTQCRFLSRDAIPFNTYTAFKHSFAIETVVTMGSRAFRKVIGYQNLERLTKLLEPFTLRIEKKDCLDLPSKTFMQHAIELTPKQQRVYDSMKNDCLALLDSGELVTSTLALTKIVKLHQILTGFVTDDEGTEHAIENNRIAALMQIAETTQPLVVFCAYKFNIKQIKEELTKRFPDKNIAEYHGDVSDRVRNQSVQDFQDGKADFFLATSAGAKGLTLHRASTMVYYSNNYSLETRLQSQDRIHRIGQDKKCTYIDLVVPQTVDDAILKRLEEKKELSSMVLDDLIQIIK